MASTVSEVTRKFDTLPRVDYHARLVDRLKDALDDACEIPTGHDIADALLKLIATAERRRIEKLPDITKEAEAA